MIEVLFDTFEKKFFFFENENREFDIGFLNGNEDIVIFDNLSFGFKATSGAQTLEFFAPSENEIFVQASQDFRFHYYLDFSPGAAVKIDFWVLNSGEKSEFSFEFVVKGPKSPYPSWVWNEGNWKPPIPYPDDGGLYEWDEDKQDWATVDPISEQGDT